MKETITGLFESAKEGSPIEYIYSLLRVHGIGIGIPDPLIDLQGAHLKSGLSEEEVADKMDSLVADIDPVLSILCNLATCSRGGHYNMEPFNDLRTGSFPNFTEPSAAQIISRTVDLLRESNHAAIADRIDEALPVQQTAEGWMELRSGTDPVNKYCIARGFVLEFIEVYFEQRLEFKGVYPFYKLPGFEVMELRTDDDVGLYGFVVHFSNGNRATYQRLQSTSECTNVMLGHLLNFNVGDLSELRDEWRVGDKRLYEIGLLGRYNGDGEWKPIIYPGDADPIREEAQRFSSDPDIQGVLFYMLCTGHRCIEFVVRCKVDLPWDKVLLGKHFHLVKCAAVQDQPVQPDYQVYDGWYDLEETDEESIRNALDQISFGVNLLAFSFEASVHWRVKYRTVEGTPGCATPTEEDLDLLDSALKGFPSGREAGILAMAIDWYNRGSSSSNVFTAFLCYYIAIESVAVEIMESDSAFGLDLPKPDKSERRAARLECIQAKHAQLYDDDPARFVREAYFECIVGLKARTRKVVEAVFGEDHEAVRALFDDEDDRMPLSEIRSDIAHGELSLLVREHEDSVRSRLAEIADISRAFLLRLTFNTDPEARPPTWSRKHQSSFSGHDPRSFLVLNTDSILPTTDWRIRPEWCE